MAKSWREREETRHVRELRKQIIKLQRELAQLKKRNSRLENDWAEMDVEVDEELEQEFKKLKKKEEKSDKNQCPKCGAYDIIELVLRGLLYYKCHGCEAKGRLGAQVD